MCDTLVALGNSTADGHVLFAKNSDREPNEAQGLLFVPHARHRAQDTIRCTYIDVPQVRETYAVVLSKPFWMFGCEMGANEAGVVMGNEAVFTRMPVDDTGLLGMDLMRLALERAGTATMALETVIALLETYGQGGIAGYQDKRFTYHNAFLIADPLEAWVLETAGREWAAQRVRDVRAISNGLSIGRDWDRASAGLVRTALARGWCRDEQAFDFARCYSAPVYTYFSASKNRRCRLTRRLEAARGGLTALHLMAMLQDHGSNDDRENLSVEHGLFMQVCAHGAWGPIRGGGAQTTASMVSELAPDRQTHWFTGTAAPCTSLFKPVQLEPGGSFDFNTVFGPQPGARFDPRVRWWAHERLHRAILEDYGARAGLFKAERDALQRDFLVGAVGGVRPDVTTACFQRADQAEADWTRRVEAALGSSRAGWLYRRFWHQQNQLAGMGRPEDAIA